MSEESRDPRYTVKKASDALGITYEFRGPGMPQYANDLHFLQPLNEWATKSMAVDELGESKRDLSLDAERVRGFLNAAFEAGREDMKREFRNLLGVRGS